MGKAKVYFTDARCLGIGHSLLKKTEHLFDLILKDCIDKGDRVAVKLHFGEEGSTAYIRPTYLRSICDKVREYGGEPFLTDTCTLPHFHWVSKCTQYDSIETAIRNGFSQETVRAPVIVSDGSIGTDDVLIDVDGIVMDNQYVARGIADADAMIVVSHVKGHPVGGAGAALKNVGIGCCSKRGKYNVHDPMTKMVVNPEECKGKDCDIWETCPQVCVEDAITVLEDRMVIDNSKCIYCPACLVLCNFWGSNAVHHPPLYQDNLLVRMADSAKAVLNTFDEGKVGYLNYLLDISPECDCLPFSDTAIVPDIGILASIDPVAVDQASLDMINQSRGLPGTKAESCNAMEPGLNKFNLINGVDPEIVVRSGEQIGIGSSDYELEKITPPDPIPSFHRFNKIKKAYKVQHPARGILKSMEVPHKMTITKDDGE